jgi:hypothetical protein
MRLAVNINIPIAMPVLTQHSLGRHWTMNKLRELMTWQYWIFGINLLLILVTAVFPYVPDGFLKWGILNRLNLAGEMNLAVWWSGGLLLQCGIDAFQLSHWDVDSRRAWMIIAVIFSLLSFDEIGSIHERIGNLTVGSTAYLIIALVAGSALLFASWILWKNKQDRKGLVLLLVGIAMLASAAPNEYLEHVLVWPGYLAGPRIAFEEGLEVSGILVCLMGIARFQPADKSRGSIVGFIPGFNHLPHIKKVLWIGFVLHIGIAWITAHYIDIGYRGNPAIWYLMAAFYLLALSYFLKWKNGSLFIVHLLVSGYCMALSTGTMYFILPNSDSRFQNVWLFDINVRHSIQLIFVFTLYLLLMRKITWRILIQFCAMAIALGSIWYLDDQFTVYAVLGFFSLMTAILFLPGEKDFIDQKPTSPSIIFGNQKFLHKFVHIEKHGSLVPRSNHDIKRKKPRIK